MIKSTIVIFSFFMLIGLNGLFATGGNEGGGFADENPDSVNATNINFDVMPLVKPVLFKRVLDRELGNRMNPDMSKVAHWDNKKLDLYEFDHAIFDDTITYVLHDPSNGIHFTRPITGKLTSGFGWRNLFGRRFHYGLDLDLNTGDPVMTALDGTVRIARYSSGYGNFVVVAHKDGLETLYGHMSKLKVVEGQKVSSGEVIGLGGNTGHSTGSHLHFEFRIFGEQVNPAFICGYEEDSDLSRIEIRVNPDWFSHVRRPAHKKVEYTHHHEHTEDVLDDHKNTAEGTEDSEDTKSPLEDTTEEDPALLENAQALNDN